MLYADQVGLPLSTCKARPDVGWVRMTTDIPTAVLEFLAGDLGLAEYLRSLQSCRTEAVFSCDDPLPGMMETLLTHIWHASEDFDSVRGDSAQGDSGTILNITW